MKLTDILFLPEAAKTAAHAVTSNLAAVHAKQDRFGASTSGGNILLVVPERVIKVFQTMGLDKNVFAKQPGELNGEFGDRIYDLKYRVAHELRKRALAASVTYWQTPHPKLWKVGSSAAVSKFGPLAYQLVMDAIYPEWLKSDSSLTTDSHAVWNKMYELSEQGVYERKWLGDFPTMDLDDFGSLVRTNRWTDSTFEALYTNKKEGDNVFPSEQEVSAYLQKKRISFKNFGFYYAYRKKLDDPAVNELYEAWDKTAQQILAMFPELTIESLNSLMMVGGNMFFNRLYH